MWKTRRATWLILFAFLVSCGRPVVPEPPTPVPTPLPAPTSNGQLVLAPPTQAGGGPSATAPASSGGTPTPIPVGAGGVTLPDQMQIEKTPTGLAVYHVRIDPAGWQQLTTTNPDVLGNTEFDITFSTGNVSLPAKIRLRGASTRFHSKKSFRVNFPKGTDFGGRTEINLLASLADPTDLLEDFFYDVMAQTRVIAPFARKVELRVNGTYYGLMTDVESVSSKRFLQSHGIDPAATIYRTAGYFDFHMLSSQQDWAKAFDQDTNKKTPDLVPPIEFVKAINRTPPDQFASWLSARMDVDEYVNYLVGNALISNDYIQHSRSYLIYEPQRQFWTFVPWDLNNSALISWNETWGADIVVKPAYAQFTPVPFTAFEFAYRPLGHDDSPRWGVLSTRVLQTPELRAKFIARLQEALNTTFTPDVMNPYIDKLYAQIEPSALADPYVNATLFKGGPAWLKQYVADRRQFLLSQIPALQALGHSGLTINEIGPSFVELHNATSAPYDLSGFYMSNDLHVPQHYTFPKGTVIPAGGFLVVKQVEVSASGGEAGLFKPTTLEQGLAGDSGVIDLVYYGPLAAGTSYARTPAGSDTWAAQDSPTPGS